MPSVGLIGLGLMGRGLGHSLLRNGYRLGIMAHRKRDVADELCAVGAWEAKTPMALASECDAVVLCVSSAEASRECLFGKEGVRASGRRGLLVIESSTLQPSVAVEVAAQLALHGIEFVDAPVTRGPREALQGKLNALVGGNPSAVERARAILGAYCERIFVMGDVGSGYAAKLINNFISFSNFATLAEATATALKTGLDMSTLLEAIGVSGGQSRALDSVGPWLAKGAEPNGIVTVTTALKDVTYFQQFAKELGTAGPIASQTVDLWAEAVDQGLGDSLTRAYIKHVASRYGMEDRLPPV